MLMQTDPFRDPFRDMDNLFGRLTSRFAEMTMPMALDALRRGDDIWVHVDLPGVKSENLEISVERNVLTISAEREWQREEGDRVYMSERARGSFRRQLQLGEGLDLDHLEADLHDGVLTLRIPLAERAKPRKIAITSTGRSEPQAIEASVTGE